MIRVLDEIRNNIVAVGEQGERKELIDALFAEILENVGDREKEVSMRWWYTNRLILWQTDDIGRGLDMRAIDTRQGEQPRIKVSSHL